MRLIEIENFISDRNYVGDGVILHPKQLQILLNFWDNPYTMGVWCLGRRSGKTFMAALSAIYACVSLAPIYRQYLRPDEKFHVLFIANNKAQASIALAQVKLFLHQSKILKLLVVADNTSSVELINGAIFKAMPNTSEGVRGYAAPFVIFDEAAHFKSGEGKTKTGEQLYQAVAPSIAQFGDDGRLLLISTPWTKQGIFYEIYDKAISTNYTEIHACNYPTWEVNPNISTKFLDEVKRRDPILFEVEYGANFSVDFAAFLDPTLIDQAVVKPTPTEPDSNQRNRYLLALDPALSGDAYTAAIGHVENKDTVVIDLYHEFAPTFYTGGKKHVNISEVENWILAQHKIYGFNKVVLDQYQSASTIQRLKKDLGSKISELTWTHKTKIEAYSTLKNLIGDNRLKLYQHPKAISQLKNLQVHYTPGGNWTVSGGSALRVDDYCSVTAAIAYLAKDYRSPNWAKFA